MIQIPTTPGGVAVVGGLALAGVLALAFAGRETGAVFRLLRGEETAVFDLTTGVTGPVRLSGHARQADGALEAPFTGTPCLAIRYAVLERRETRNGSSWVEVDSGVAAKPFLLDDGSESVLVEPDRVRLALDRSAEVAVDGGDRPPEQIREFVAESDDVDSEERSWSLFGLEIDVGDDRRYVEHRLDPGDAVTVFGEARDRQGLDTRSGQVNAVVTSGAHPLVISETTPLLTLVRVFWPVLIAGVAGLGLLAAAAVLVLG